MEPHTFFADTLLVSDIHAGWRFSRADACAALIRNFRGRRLVILGDAFHHPRYLRIDAETRKLIAAINGAIALGIETIFTHGNHDPSTEIISLLLPGAKVCREFRWQSGSHCCFAEHGHKHNGRNRHAWLIGDLLKEIPDNIHHFIQRLESRRHHFSRFVRRAVELIFGLNNAVIDGMAEYLTQQRAKTDFAFFGHTHFAEIRQIGTTRFCNPGCWVGYDDGALSYAIIDNDGNLEIKRYAT